MDWKSFGASTAKTAASGVVGTLGDIAVSAVNNYYMKQQYQREVEQEQRTYERNRRDYLADLESERQYNSATSQLARLREAGLNPNLMGEGSLSAGVSSGAQMMGNGTMTGLGPVTVGNGLGSGLISMSTADATRSRTDAQNASDYAYAQLQSELSATEEEFRPIRKALIKAQEALADGQTELAAKQAEVAIETAKKLSVEANKAEEFMDAQIFKENSIGNLNTANANLAAAKVITETLVTEFQRVENNWQKYMKWHNVAKDVIGVGLQIGDLVKGFQIMKIVASKSLKPAQRGKFISAIDEILKSYSNNSSYSLPAQKSLSLPTFD